MRSIKRVVPFALALSLIACNFAAKKAPAAPKLVAPTAEEAQRFAGEFMEAVSKPNVTRASMMIDWDVLLGRALADTQGSSQFRAGFIKGAKEKSQTSSYVQQLANAVAQGGKISLLRVRGDEGGRSALLRVVLPNGGVTYNEMLLTRDDKGVVRAADVYGYATAEYMSDTLKRMYKFGAGSEPTFIERLQKKKNPMVKMAQMYKEMAEKTASGQNEEAVALFRRMPPELRKEKSVLVAYVSAASNLDNVQYEVAIDELRRAFPNDAGMDLMLIDGFILNERYDDALAAIDRLDKDLDGDPYLDALRANICVAKGDSTAADRFARRAAEREPWLASVVKR
jgi:hypothetical protein